MIKSVSIKTITELDKKNGNFLITSFSDLNEDGSRTPTIFRAKILETSLEIDGEPGKEGELLISHDNEKVGEINKNSELILETEKDNVDKYSLDRENLIYTDNG